MITGLFRRKKNNMNSFVDGFLTSCWNIEKFDTDIANVYKSLSDEDKKNQHKQHITYELNWEGFRSSKNNNVKIKQKDYNSVVACFGCSNTHGVGVSWDETWPMVLNKHLGDNWLVKNYGRCGASCDTISRLIYNYVKIETPDKICCFFPDITRIEMYDDGLSNYCPQYWAGSKEKHDAYLKLIGEEYGQYLFIKNYKFIEALCKLHKIDFYWSTWSTVIMDWSYDKLKAFLNVGNYLPLTRDILWKTERARDGQHFGRIAQKTIGEGFADLMKNGG